VIGEHLLHPAFLFGFLLERIQMLQQQITQVVHWLEVDGQHAMVAKDITFVSQRQKYSLDAGVLLDTGSPVGYLLW
jgi:hypothetical protein